MRKTKLEIGDRITFKAATRASFAKLTRVVNGFWVDGRPTVRAHGYGEFIVDWREIQSVQRKEA